MKNIIFVLVAFVSTSCANSTVHRTIASNDPFQSLLADANSKAVFPQTTKQEHCPKFFTPIESTELPAHAQVGDHSIYLNSFVLGQQNSGDFTYEGNRIYYRPGLAEGQMHVLSRNVDFPLGIAFSEAKQTVQGSVLTTEYSARVGSVAMIAATKYRLQYDANAHTINYHFEGSGVADVDCAFRKIQ